MTRNEKMNHTAPRIEDVKRILTNDYTFEVIHTINEYFLVECKEDSIMHYISFKWVEMQHAEGRAELEF